MKKFITRSLTLLTFITASVSCAPALEKNMKKAENLHNGFSGLALYDTEADKMILEYNADKYFTPASNTKILTLFTGLKTLEDSIVTFLYTENKDSLIFTATGDPTLLNPKFSEVENLKILKNSPKKLYYQSANWDEDEYGSGWAWDDLDYSFSAQRSAIPVFGNLVHFEFDKKDKILNTIPGIFQDSVSFQKRSGIHRITNSNQFLASKEIAKDFSRDVPFQTSEALSIQLLEQQVNQPIEIINTKISLDKKVYSVLADSLYREMMHQSDNFIAEQILLMSAAKISDTMNTKIAIDHIQNTYFKNLKHEIYWVDGSGLSRYNLATPNSMVEILRMILQEKSVEEIKNIFPQAGKEGTLKNLLVGEDPFVFAKSGSLRNNYSLSGFLISNRGKVLIFSFMNANYTLPSVELKAEIEKLLLQIRNKY